MKNQSNEEKNLKIDIENEVVKTKDEKNDISLKSQFKNAFINWLEASSSHGLPKAVKAENIVNRLIWSIFFVISIGGCSYFFISTLISYFKYQPVVQVAVVQEWPTRFPAVTICNLNSVNLRSNDTQDYVNSLFTQSNYSFLITATTADQIQAYTGTGDTGDIISDATDLLKRLIAVDKNLSFTDRQSIGFSLGNDMLISCKFNGAKCSSTDFSTFISYEYGNCYTFNGGYDSAGTKQNTLQTSEVGIKNGLHLELLVGDPTGTSKYTTKSGLFLVVLNETRPLIAIDDGDGINIASGLETFVSIKREFRSKLENPYSNCVTSLRSPPNDYAKKLYAIIQRENVTSYDQQFCYDLCYQDKLTSKCNCADPKYPLISSVPYCVVNDDLYCLNEYQSYFSSSNIEVLCSYSCPIACDTILYELSTSVATYPTEYYYNLLSTRKDFIDNFIRNDTVVYSKIKDYLMKVVVNYNDLSYVYIQEVPSTSIESLVGTVGGLFGLFIGLSLLSVVEIIELIAEFIRIVVIHRQLKRSIKPD